MGRIRKLYFFDKKSTEEMISFLNNNVSDNYINQIMFNFFAPLHHLLPLSLKFLPESYVLKENKTLKGLITIAPIKNSNKKVEIEKLLFEENSLADAAELVQFAVSKYKAMGATSVLVKVDDYLPELLNMLVSKCSFSQISYEKLWRVNKFIDSNFDKRCYRPFRNSDSQAVANLYNDSLAPHFRPLLSKDSKEFRENIFKGLSYYSEYKYVIENKKDHNLVGYISILTTDNENFLVDIIQSNWVELDINSVLAYAVNRISKRKKKFGVFVRTKRYVTLGDKYDKMFLDNGYECVQNQIVLTNSSAKILKESEKSPKYTVIGQFCPAKPISTSSTKICKDL